MKTHELGAEIAENFLEHYGVKGMRWGVRRKSDPIPDGEVRIKTRAGKKVKAEGGKRSPVAEDAIEAARLRQVAKRSTTDSLSNQELQKLIARMTLEDSYDRLIKSDVRIHKGKLFARKVLKDVNGDDAVGLVTTGRLKSGKGPLSEGAARSITIGTGIVKAFVGGGKKK